MHENQKDNDLFFTCSLLEAVARATKNTKKDILKVISKENIAKIYSLADIYHSENIEKVVNELIEKYHIKTGTYNIRKSQGKIPTIWEIGRVYERLIIMVNNNQAQYIDTLYEVLSSWIIPKIDNYDIVCTMKIPVISTPVTKKRKFFKRAYQKMLFSTAHLLP